MKQAIYDYLVSELHPFQNAIIVNITSHDSQDANALSAMVSAVIALLKEYNPTSEKWLEV